MDVPNDRRRYLLLSAVCLSLAACGQEADRRTVLEKTAAGEFASGPGVGEAVGAFQVVKVGGIDDGVPIGKQLCYR